MPELRGTFVLQSYNCLCMVRVVGYMRSSLCVCVLHGDFCARGMYPFISNSMWVRIEAVLLDTKINIKNSFNLREFWRMYQIYKTDRIQIEPMVFMQQTLGLT